MHKECIGIQSFCKHVLPSKSNQKVTLSTGDVNQGGPVWITTVNQEGPIRGSCLLICPVTRGHHKVMLCKVRLVPQSRIRLVPQGVDTILLQQNCLEAGLTSGVPKHPKWIYEPLPHKSYAQLLFNAQSLLNRLCHSF